MDHSAHSLSRGPHRMAAAVLVLVLILAALAAAFWNADWSPGRRALIALTDWIADHVLANVEQPLDFELPVTHAGVRGTPGMVAAIGGQGRGLDCSLPTWGAYFFRDRDGVAPVSFRFRQACAFHDLCYRHGLATYGYVQNDCDESLQDHAFRVCRYIFRGPQSVEACRTEAKKITLAVRLGGSDSFQGWDRSTYYEFDPFPTRARAFSAHRLLPAAGRNLAERDLVRFEVTRAAVWASCVGCPGPAALRRAIPLARDGVYVPPQVVPLPSGEADLVFATRIGARNTNAYAAVGRWSGADKTVSLRSPGERIDLLGSTVQAVVLPGSDTGLVTPSVGCGAPFRLRLVSGTAGQGFDRRCADLSTAAESLLSGDVYRFFQHPPAIDARRGWTVLAKRGDDRVGRGYDQRATLLVADYPARVLDGTAPYTLTVKVGVGLAETHEPFSILPLDGPAPILLSLSAPLGAQNLALVETDLALASPEPVARPLRLGGSTVRLPWDWAQRPPLLLETALGPALVMTRAATVEQGVGAVALDLLILRRGVAREGGWSAAEAGRCRIAYSINVFDDQNACRHRPDRRIPTAVNQMRGAQALAAERGDGGFDVILPDACLTQAPLLFASNAAGGGWTPGITPAARAVGGGATGPARSPDSNPATGLTRNLTCAPLPPAGVLTAVLPDPVEAFPHEAQATP